MLDILIVYEHRARELPSVALLNLELEHRGYIVDVVSKDDLKRQRSFYRRNKPKMIVVPALYSTDSVYNQAYRFVGKISKIVNLQWEQVFSSVSEQLDFRMPTGLAKEAGHVCWGEISYDRLKEFGCDNLRITGAMHLDFYRPEFQEYDMSREELFQKYKLDVNKKVCLFISSYALASYTEAQREIFQNTVGYDITNNVRACKESQSETLSWFEKILTSHPDMLIIYRPHPAEHGNDRLAVLENTYSNFKVISEETVRQWTKVSDVVMVWMSTSIVEVLSSGKPCYIVRPQPVPLTMDADIYRNCQAINSYEQLEMALTDGLADYKPLDQNVFDGYYSNDSKAPAYVRVADYLEDLLHTDKWDIHDDNYNGSKIRKLRRNSFIKYIINRIGIKFSSESWMAKTWLGKKLNLYWDQLEYYASDYADSKEYEDLKEGLRPYVEKIYARRIREVSDEK